MGAHDSAENVPSIADYLSAGELLPLVMLLTFDESAAFSIPEAGNVLIARIGRTSIKAKYGMVDGPDTIALHVHDSTEGAQECHRLSVDQLAVLATMAGVELQPI